MPWKSRASSPIERERDQLRTEVVRLKHDLEGKERFVDRLEFLLRSRLTRIDDLTGRLDQARAANQRLEQECEHLAELVKG
jgi:hypothetical protein